MPISTLCLLQFQLPSAEGSTPALHLPAQLRVAALTDGILLHTPLEFTADPEALARAVRTALGEPLAQQHKDPRGVLLIPSIAAPQARTYAAVIDEVGEGGVWGRWSAPSRASAAPDLTQLFGEMLGQVPGGLDPSALRAASAALPGLLANPAELAQLVKSASSELPPLDNLLRGLGIDLGSADLQRMTGALADEFARDPNKLAALAEQLFEQAGDEADDEQDDAYEEDDEAATTPNKPRNTP